MPQVNPDLLRWARESAGLSRAEAVTRLGLRRACGIEPVERLRALEVGGNAPTRAMLSKMAEKYRRPLVTFYLEQPPAKSDRGSDFRTVAANQSREDEALLDALVRNLLASQALLKSALLDEEDAEPLPFVGSAARADGVEAVTSSMRVALELSLDRYRVTACTDAAFRLLRRRAEDAGIFVLLAGNLGTHHTDLDVDVLRGMALADEIAPFVVVNPRDSAGARCFTLLHELAHLRLGQTGISGWLPPRPRGTVLQRRGFGAPAAGCRVVRAMGRG